LLDEVEIVVLLYPEEHVASETANRGFFCLTMWASLTPTRVQGQNVESNGDSYLIVQTIVEDPTYLNQKFITSTHFKKQVDASGWNPTPCIAR